ncbi:Hypothetical protein PFR_JS9-2_2012 [Propionibacterium freudenreichii]|nr:Hypothetical protein PFR_JS9-1_2014 [Propionibacterium freudenreichii]SCQ70565.1 Hypothetical protein PFR_JS9-2_2012 [Propionibacterium freudenreichii]
MDRRRAIHMGSPPRMRGELVGVLDADRGQGITPAYAGRTARCPPRGSVRPDHPRVCGENPVNQSMTGWMMGSPPRMRGEQATEFAMAEVIGITPAYAGRTPGGDITIALQDGSPPRMRGERPRRDADRRPTGITPAYAGRTSRAARWRRAIPDHPRVCGENRPMWASVVVSDGSPPRMRGEPVATDHESHGERITPAYAGRTFGNRASNVGAVDHPRVCGENHESHGELVPGAGSPPRMRGELSQQVQRHCRDGITPAYAGRTLGSLARRRRRQDHPRVCGENWVAALIASPAAGSPPRMRGELCLPVSAWLLRGITPAYAGRTGDG